MNYIRDHVAKYNLQTEDVLRKMNLHKDHPPVEIQALTRSINLLDPSLNLQRAEKIAQEILGVHKEINIKDLIRALGCPQGRVKFDKLFYMVSSR